MTTLHNQIDINAPIEKIWDALVEIEKLDRYDPTVKDSKATSDRKHGLGASRKVTMKDGKNWFTEECTELKENEALTYDLTACSFPVKNLKHRYTFELNNGAITVKQKMTYTMKYGFLGKIMDKLMVKRQSQDGIIKFMKGLKKYAESDQGSLTK